MTDNQPEEQGKGLSPKEVMDFILKHMTAEEALLKLLEGSLGQYENLKFDEGKEVHPLMIISMAAFDLGWDFAIEKNQEHIEGLAIGTQEYMARLFNGEKKEVNPVKLEINGEDIDESNS